MRTLLWAAAAVLVVSPLLAGCNIDSRTENDVRTSSGFEPNILNTPSTSEELPLPQEEAWTSSLRGFPTSSRPAASSWANINEDGYKGNFDAACKLLGLGAPNEYFCQKYQDMLDTNQCQVTNLPNGVVFDRQVFTNSKTGVHTVQHHVRVALEDPPSREVKLCRLSKNLWVGQINYCNNHFRIDTGATSTSTPVAADPKPKTQTPAPLKSGQAFKPVPIQKATTAICPMGRSVYYHVWPLSKIPPDLRDEVGLFSSRAEEFVTEDVSRTLGQKFRELHAAGKLPRASGTHPLEARWIKVNQNGYMGYGTEVVEARDADTVVVNDGFRQVRYSPELFENWTLSVRVPPGDVDRYASASFGDNGRRELRSFPTERLGACSTHVHFVDRTQ